MLQNLIIIEADNGLSLIDCIKQADHTQVSLILLDMNMPLMNGLETASAIRADPAFTVIPIVMISTTSNNELIERACQAGIDHYFIKPNTFEGYIDLALQLKSRFIA